MTEQPEPSSADRKVSKEFAAVQAELKSEDNLLSMMMEQLPSMMGMAFMFILTIGIALFIRPWYDIASLQAFGESGASQVRYIALELFMIFVFTACILLLAKYKKEWIIKYGIMGVLSIALMYTTVPLAHMLVLDLDVEPFAYESENELDMSYLSHHGLDSHLTNTLLGSPGMWNDSIHVYHGESLVNATPAWTMTQERLPYDDLGELRVVVSEELSHLKGLDEKGNIQKVMIYPKKSKAMNLAFDVTPAKYVTGLITEKGICEASTDGLKELFK